MWTKPLLLEHPNSCIRGRDQSSFSALAEPKHSRIIKNVESGRECVSSRFRGCVEVGFCISGHPKSQAVGSRCCMHVWPDHDSETVKKGST